MAKTDPPASVREIACRLAEPSPMRRGSLSQRYVKCSKPGCRCSEDPEARHGPYTSVVRTVGGRTQSRLVPASQADMLRSQIEDGKQFRQDVEAYWRACEVWADAELDAAEATSQEGAKKGASKQRSKPRSSSRSKRS